MTILHSYERTVRIQKAAEGRFTETFLFGTVVRLVRRLLGQRIQLRFLDEYEANAYTPVQAGQRAVDIDKIVGTSGRADRFDCNFRPIQPRGRGRWTSVASAMMDDITRIPPVSLIQVGDEYFVIDGHHRISAARALRKAFIDAKITRWDPIA